MINIFEIYDCQFSKSYNHVHCCTDKDLGLLIFRKSLIEAWSVNSVLLCIYLLFIIFSRLVYLEMNEFIKQSF